MRKRKRHSAGRALVALFIGAGCICLAIAGFWMKDDFSWEAVSGQLSRGKSTAAEKEIKISDAEVGEKFYYQQLANEEKLVYREILQGISENEEEIRLDAKDAERVNQIYQNVLDDEPEIFWCDGKATSTAYSAVPGQDAYVVIRPNYIYEGEEKERRIQEIEKAAETCISGIDENAGEYDKIKYIYSYLIDSVDYDLDAPDNQNIYSALIGKRSVCAGYARSCQYLLGKMGIYCIYVTGTTTDPNGGVSDHAWNIVRCNGSYYYMDATWGDPVFLGEESEKNVPDVIAYDYLCCSEKELEKTHTLTEGYDYPECVSDDLNYYRLNGMFYDSFDRQRMEDAIYRSIDEGEAYTVFKMADDASYQEMADLMESELIEEGARYLGERYGLTRISYSYSEEPSLDKFIIYWFYE